MIGEKLILDGSNLEKLEEMSQKLSSSKRVAISAEALAQKALEQGISSSDLESFSNKRTINLDFRSKNDENLKDDIFE